MSCSSSCKTQDHESYGACLRAKGIQVGDLMNTGIQKAGAQNLERYRQARKEGIQPRSTRPADVQAAIQISDQTGKAFQA